MISGRRLQVARDIIFAELRKLAKTHPFQVHGCRVQIIAWLAHCCGLEEKHLAELLPILREYQIEGSGQLEFLTNPAAAENQQQGGES
jgi:hypothetical protein